MRHSNRNKKFGRVRKGRRALMRSLSRSLILRERVQTTLAKAKALRPFVERLISSARKGDLASRRRIRSRLGDAEAAARLMGDIAARYASRQGGYTRVVKAPRRASDGAETAIIELV